MKKLVSLLFFLAFAIKGYGQILSSKTLNLEPGEQIYDVVDFPTLNCFMVVGNFTKINSIPFKKLAFIDKTTLTPINASWAKPIDNIDGDIFTAEVVHVHPILLPITHNYYLFIGGNFNTITVNGTTYTRNGIAKLTTSKLGANPTPNNFSLNAWNPQLDIGANPAHGVRSMDVSGDTVFYSGNFGAINNGALPSDFRYSGVAAVHGVTGTNLNLFNSSDGATGIKYIDWKNNKLYISGNLDPVIGNMASMLRMNPDGSIDPSFDPLGFELVGECGCINGSGCDFAFVHDTILVYQWDTNDDVYARNAVSDVFNIDQTPDSIYSNSTIFTKHTSIATYKNYSYINRNKSQDGALPFDLPSLFSTTYLPNNIPSSDFYAFMNCDFSNFDFEHLWVIDNMLIVSDVALTQIGAWWQTQYTRNGAAIYCLEPMDVAAFSTFDTLVCPEQSELYTIPSVAYADGYVWEYSGVGVDIGETGIENLSDTLHFTNANSINIAFLTNFTPGVLSVTPFSDLNGQIVEYGTIIKSNTISINIHSNPLPHIDAGNDTTLTCAIDSVLLYGFSNDPVISYEWLNAIAPHNVGQDTMVTQSGYYVFKVKDGLGCPNFDTVFVDLNNTKPIALPPTGTYDLTCAQSVKNFLGSTSSSNTIAEWFDVANGTYHTNPISVSLPGAYTFIVTDTINGCPKDTSIFVTLNAAQPAVNIQNYASINPILFENLTCLIDSLELICYSSTSNSIAEWTNSAGTIFYGDTLIITTPGIYYIQSTSNDNGCTNTVNINIASNQNLPNSNVPTTQLLNCSVDSILLDGNSLAAGANLKWNGPSVIQANDPVTIYNSGIYYLTVTDTINGCTVTDSVIVNQDASINVFAGNDTLVCNQALVNLTANYTGSITGINYLWNSGSTNNSELFTAGTDNFAAVEIFGDNGCYGVDTVHLDLPPVPVINFTGYKPCDDGPSGSIVANPVSGMAPFLYSIDDGNNYQSSETFTGLYIGTYPIWVKDSLLCDYQYSGTIDVNSALPTPSFLFSTYNYESDTVVIIDTSNPPTDSTNWIFPNEIIVLNNNSMSPTILLPDTGIFVITMQAYYGNCLVELNKTIYASPFDSTAANHYNQNGIKSITLYPNPTSGSFVVNVEFYKSQRSAFVIQDMIGYTYENREFDELTGFSESITLNISAENGTYVLKLVSEFDSASLTFILTR